MTHWQEIKARKAAKVTAERKKAAEALASWSRQEADPRRADSIAHFMRPDNKLTDAIARALLDAKAEGMEEARRDFHEGHERWCERGECDCGEDQRREERKAAKLRDEAKGGGG